VRRRKECWFVLLLVISDLIFDLVCLHFYTYCVEGGEEEEEEELYIFVVFTEI
jgi:hypothetical protein